MPKFRKRPVIVEAWQWHPLVKSGDILHWFIMSNYDLGPNDTLEITTLEGVVVVNPDDWIIQDAMGEISACRPDIFEATYEPAIVFRDVME